MKRLNLRVLRAKKINFVVALKRLVEERKPKRQDEAGCQHNVSPPGCYHLTGTPGSRGHTSMLG